MSFIFVLIFTIYTDKVYSKPRDLQRNDKEESKCLKSFLISYFKVHLSMSLLTKAPLCVSDQTVFVSRAKSIKNEMCHESTAIDTKNKFNFLVSCNCFEC